MTVYLLQYNNYYNRLVKSEESFNNGYDRYVVAQLPSTNFKPNDYVNTELIYNLNVNSQGNNFINGDYIVVVDDYSQIVSRWFVTESVRVSNAQHRFTLRRDVIADYYNIIKESPMFIEKAMLDSGNPLIFNNENMTYNQIKKRQTDLYDESGKAWIAIYCGLDILSQGESTKEIKFKTQSVESPYLRSDIPSSGIIYNNDAELQIDEKVIKSNGAINYYSATKYWVTGQYQRNSSTPSAIPTTVTEAQRQIIANVVKGYDFSSYITNPTENAIKYNGVTVKGADNNYYQVEVKQVQKTITERFYWGDRLGTDIVNATGITGANSVTNKVSISVIEQTVTFTQVQSYTAELKFNITSSTVYCEDSPYYLLYLPYSETNLNLAIGIGTALASKCYDIQVVPYAPEVRTRTDDLPTTLGKDTIAIYDGTNIVTYLYASKYSSFAFTIDNVNITVPSDAIDLKIANETEFIRLNSPNGSGSFEFIPAKNYGIERFNVECSYKPVMPYINVSPQFKGLYGQDFKDYRGLICQGDFSVPMISNEWINFEQNNKNYQNIFDREIENMNVNNKYARIQERVGVGVGTLQGAIGGATAGGAVGGPWGAVAGTAVGMTSSLLGGLTDLTINERLRDEAKDFKTDMFGYTLGNIKAKPNTLSKTGSITIDSHFVPYIEYYGCTETEKEALRNKIKYNGMTVGVIGKMSDYINENGEYQYFKGQLIRIEGIDDDFHLVNTIASELNKGVYVK